MLALKQALRPSWQTCRAFSSIPARAAPPSSPSSSTFAKDAQTALTPGQVGTNQLLEMVEEIAAGPPIEEVENPAAILRHLSRNQIISPQHLSPRNLLVPYPQRPNFTRAYPLGPPTEFGPTHDQFVRYGIDPLKPENGVLNPFVLSPFVTSMGKIQPRGKTMLQRKSQRKIGKAIRRARVRLSTPHVVSFTALGYLGHTGIAYSHLSSLATLQSMGVIPTFGVCTPPYERS
ncbi:hypothetical protein JCM11641_002400 [Rhodosporidiobolus odoratus]